MVFWANCLLLVLILLTILYLSVARLIFTYQAFRKNQTLANWELVFRAIQKNEPYSLPEFRRGQGDSLLEIWVNQRQYCEHSHAIRLDELANQIQLDRKIVSVLRPSRFGLLPRKIWLQTLAINAAQWIDSDEIRAQVFRASESNVQSLAVSACACLINLKAKGWERAVVKTLLRFPTGTTYFSNQISKVGGYELLKTFAPFLSNLPTNTVMNFFALAEQSRDKTLLPLLEARLAIATRDKEIAALLRTIGRLGGPEQRELVSGYLSHSNIFIQVQALKAIGRVGRIKDIELIIPHLSHPEWWVRYRAARALLKLSGEHREIVYKIRDGIKDDYARDILIHASAEVEWCLI